MAATLTPYQAGFREGVTAALSPEHTHHGHEGVPTEVLTPEQRGFRDGFAAYRRCDAEEREVYAAVVALNGYGKTTNASQVSSRAVLPRTRATKVLQSLEARRLIRDVGKGSAYHWRAVTS